MRRGQRRWKREAPLCQPGAKQLNFRSSNRRQPTGALTMPDNVKLLRETADHHWQFHVPLMRQWVAERVENGARGS
jgi:hypothetical protein